MYLFDVHNRLINVDNKFLYVITIIIRKPGLDSFVYYIRQRESFEGTDMDSI